MNINITVVYLYLYAIPIHNTCVVFSFYRYVTKDMWFPTKLRGVKESVLSITWFIAFCISVFCESFTLIFFMDILKCSFEKSIVFGVQKLSFCLNLSNGDNKNNCIKNSVIICVNFWKTLDPKKSILNWIRLLPRCFIMLGHQMSWPRLNLSSTFYSRKLGESCNIVIVGIIRTNSLCCYVHVRIT